MKTRIRSFIALSVAAAAGAAVLGAGIASADETAGSAAGAPGRTSCITLLTDGTSGVAQGGSDQPSQFTLSVQVDGGFQLVSRSAAGVTQWSADIPAGSAAWGAPRVLQACAENQGQEPASVFLRIETDEDNEAVVAPPADTTPAPAPVPDMGQVVVDPQPLPSTGTTVANLVQSVLDDVAAIVANVAAGLGA